MLDRYLENLAYTTHTQIGLFHISVFGWKSDFCMTNAPGVCLYTQKGLWT